MRRINLKTRDGKFISFDAVHDPDTDRPVVTEAGLQYLTLAELVAAYPALGSDEQRTLYCKFCLHYFPGPGNILIEDPAQYRDRYEALVRYGSDPTGANAMTADFGPFDTTEIGSPRIDQGKLVFYAEDSLYSVPYRVEAPWPASANDKVKFLLLPLSGQ
jgi:hypothetical protein